MIFPKIDWSHVPFLKQIKDPFYSLLKMKKEKMQRR
jgi:hypothetical protein